MRTFFTVYPKLICFLLLFSLVATSRLFAQTIPVKQWDKRFGGSGTEYLHLVQQTTDGEYILGRQSSSGADGDKSQSSQSFQDYWIVKTDAAGNKQWDKRFGGSGSDILYSLQQT